jgi:regulator of sigma E protease
MSILLLILGIVLFVGLVIIHELGHFFVARRNGVEVEEFGIGFPPRAWARKTKGGWFFSVNWLPIGGFVKLKGENDADKRPGSLGAATTWVKAKIMLAGVAMNLVVAFVLLMVLAWIGMPKLLDNQFTVKSDTKVTQQQVLAGYVDKDSPADKAGLKARDQIISIESETVSTASELPVLTKKYAGQEVSIVYIRDDVTHTKTVTLRTEKDAKDKGILGVTPTEYALQRSTWSAPIVAGGLIGQFTAATFQGLGHAIGALFQGDPGKASEQVSGPVGIIVLLKEGSLLGVQFILLIISVISLTLAIMNILPIPALDGGRLFVILLSRLFKKQISEQMEERIVGTSFLFLMFLIILITVVDVRRFF